MMVEKEPLKSHNRRVHMANERTFLAWIRTSIGLMAFGFVVEKFALFVKQMAYFIQRAEGGAAGQATVTPPHAPGYSSVLGIVLVGLGAIMGFLAFVRYKKVERQIEEDTYHPSLILDMLLAISVVSIGVFLITYLVYSI